VLEPSTDIVTTDQSRARWRLVALALALAIIAVVLWRFTPLSDYADPDRLITWISTVRDSPWAAPVLILLFVIGGLVVFPLTVLIAVSALMFEPALALFVAFMGTLANAVVTYGVGAKLLRGTALAAAGPAIARATTALENSGVIAVAVIRMVPVAPFTFVNVAAGSIGVRLRDYILGTALGVAPGILALTFFGQQLQSILRDPSPSGIFTLFGVVILWIGLSLLLQKVITRSRGKGIGDRRGRVDV
jgi:uncharacterized membrane protein YdjX (TVP38/TMEM64 family)